MTSERLLNMSIEVLYLPTKFYTSPPLKKKFWLRPWLYFHYSQDRHLELLYFVVWFAAGSANIYVDFSRLAVDMDIHGYIHGYYAGTPAN